MAKNFEAYAVLDPYKTAAIAMALRFQLLGDPDWAAKTTSWLDSVTWLGKRQGFWLLRGLLFDKKATAKEKVKFVHPSSSTVARLYKHGQLCEPETVALSVMQVPPSLEEMGQRVGFDVSAENVLTIYTEEYVET